MSDPKQVWFLFLGNFLSQALAAHIAYDMKREVESRRLTPVSRRVKRQFIDEFGSLNPRTYADLDHKQLAELRHQARQDISPLMSLSEEIKTLLEENREEIIAKLTEVIAGIDDQSLFNDLHLSSSPSSLIISYQIDFPLKPSPFASMVLKLVGEINEYFIDHKNHPSISKFNFLFKNTLKQIHDSQIKAVRILRSKETPSTAFAKLTEVWLSEFVKRFLPTGSSPETIIAKFANDRTLLPSDLDQLSDFSVYLDEE